ncbi:DUF3500 domain-containing protein [Rhodococcus opacus]|uniref:DUF3500 domain-containing protein n=1 Tax=Rhodococcus opacus TaxID=37919 RepID=UPI001C202D29|nr:DUF3500 domain-containing protein [Rhodococcus opacus]
MYEAIIKPVRPFTGVKLTGDSPGQTTSWPPPGPADRATAAAITDAIRALLEVLDDDQRRRISYPADAPQWQTWLNTHPNIVRQGVILEELSGSQRDRVLSLMEASLSKRGFQQARDIMRINGYLVELTGRDEDFGEWPYFLTVFGVPGEGASWGWQLDGHHLNLNVVVADGRVVTTPAFMGSEPTTLTSGPLAGTTVLRAEHEAGLRFMRSLDAEQQAVAISRPSIRTADLPSELTHLINGRTQAGPFTDSLEMAHEGVLGSDLDGRQRRALKDAISTYLHWSPPTNAAVREALVNEHLDQTSVTWMGDVTDRGPFYYRILSPVVLIEFDHHAGTVFDNPDPSWHHIHTLVRTPRGGDYGVDLIRRHHEQYDHSDGGHRLWT